MRLYKFIQVTIIFVLLTSCANNQFDNISKLIGKEIRFPKRLYATYNGKDTTTSSIPPIKLLIYKNNQNCSICSTTSLSQYKAIIDYTRENKDFGVVIIYSSNDSNYLDLGEFYQFNLSSCIRQQNSLTAQFVSFSLSNLANIFYPPPIFTIINLCLL